MEGGDETENLGYGVYDLVQFSNCLVWLGLVKLKNK